jgi:hypothetical protein
LLYRLRSLRLAALTILVNHFIRRGAYFTVLLGIIVTIEIAIIKVFFKTSKKRFIFVGR